MGRQGRRISITGFYFQNYVRAHGSIARQTAEIKSRLRASAIARNASSPDISVRKLPRSRIPCLPPLLTRLTKSITEIHSRGRKLTRDVTSFQDKRHRRTTSRRREASEEVGSCSSRASCERAKQPEKKSTGETDDVTRLGYSASILIDPTSGGPRPYWRTPSELTAGDAHAPPNWKSHVDTPMESGVLSTKSLRSSLCPAIIRLRSGR